MDGAVCFLPEQRLWASGSLCIARVRTDGLREQGLPGSDGVEGEEEADSPAELAASPHPEFAGFVAGVMERECDQL